MPERIRLAVAVLLLAAGSAEAADLRIAAASDLRFAMDEILADFREAYPEHEVEVIYGSSGQFRAQIANGAPYDLFFSADVAYPEALRQEGLVHGELMPYALGRVVIWSNTVDASQLRLEDLADGDRFDRVAIANPSHAPYGARAEEALRSAGAWEAVQPRLVLGENIAHTLQMIQSGAAEVGIVALSLALSPRVAEQGDHHLIDSERHEPLEQAFVVTERGADNQAAHALARYMYEPGSREIMEAYGFVLPEEREIPLDALDQ